MNYAYSICPICGRPIATENSPFTADIACRCQWRVTFTTSDSATAFSASDWNKQLEAMRNWKVTLHGRIDGQKPSVPQPFQDAFGDGDLEL